MVATDKWQRITEFEVCEGMFLVHVYQFIFLICDREFGHALALLQVIPLLVS